MKYNCNIIRDLLPLYQDEVCSEESAAIVREHLQECPDCSALLKKMQGTEIETAVASEKQEVLREQSRFFKRKSTLAGTIVAGIFMIPILVCFIVNIATGHGLTWFFIVLTSLLLAASLIIVPIMARENKALWMLGSSTASLILLLGVIAIYTRGDWFFVAALSTLFGLSVVFLPFAVRAKPIAERLGGNKALTVLAVDTILFALMMLAIGLKVSRFGGFGRMLHEMIAIAGPFLLLAWAIFAILRYLKCSRLAKAGSVIILVGLFEFFANFFINLLLGNADELPRFSPAVWNYMTVDGNLKWILLIGSLAVGTILIIVGLVKGPKKDLPAEA